MTRRDANRGDAVVAGAAAAPSSLVVAPERNIASPAIPLAELL